MVLVGRVGAPPGGKDRVTTSCVVHTMLKETGRDGRSEHVIFSRFSRLLCFLSGGERVTYRRRRRHNTTHWDTRGHMRATPDAALPVRPFLTPLALCVALPTMLLIELIHALRLAGGEVCLYNVVGYRLPVGLVIWK